MKHLRYLLMAALVAMPLTACDDDDDGDIVAPPATGTVSGTVSAEGDGLAGVSVTLVGATSQSATTGSGGSFSFTNVEAGSYGVTISDVPAGVSFSTTAKTTSITTDGQTVTVDFSGSYIRTSTIAGQVVVDGDGIAAVAVTATGPEGTDNAVTDNGGNYSFSGLRAGDYTVAIDAPADYTFATTSYDITLGTGEAKTASFFGEMVVTEDPVTASVVIESVKDDDGDFVDPSDVYRDIYVTLGIDPGENKLARVCLLLDGAELPNGCQTFSSAVSDQELQAALNPTFAILTADFDEETGVPAWLNGDHELSAKLELVGAMESSVVTSMMLTFDNSDDILGYVMPEFAEVGGGAQWFGGVQTLEIFPVLYSGKELETIEIRWYFDGYGAEYFDVDGPFPTTAVFDPATIDDDWAATNWGFTTTDDVDSYVRFYDGLYADGTVRTFYDYALMNRTEERYANFDFGVPTWAGALNLTDQLAIGASGEAELACCSNNWVGPDYAPAAGLTADPTDAGVGVETVYFTVEDLATEEVYTIAEDGTVADAGISLSFTNDEFELCAVATDFFGNESSICQLPAGSNTLATFGFDNTPPTNQSFTAPPAQYTFNLLNTAKDLGGLTVTASEDRSGFSALSFRAYMQWWDAANDEGVYIVAQDDEDGGMVNLAQSMASCAGATPMAGGTICYPSGTSADGVYYVTGARNNQAGLMADDPFEGWVYNDQTPPTVENVALPGTVEIGAPATFSANVHDNLHVGTTNFAFEPAGLGAFIPLGDIVEGTNTDSDKWDGIFPTSETATLTLNPAIVGLQEFGVWTTYPFTSVRATHTDLAGNESVQVGNNFIPGTVDAPMSYELDGITAFDAVAPTAAVNLCNGQGATACDTDGGDVTSVTVTVVAEGPGGTFPNPFLTGDIYFYALVVDYDLLGSVPAANVAIDDDGTTRTYTWSFTITSADAARYPAGTVLNLTAIGVKDSYGTGLLVGSANSNITIVDGS